MVADIQLDMRRLVLEMRMVDKAFAASLRREIRAACLELGDDVLRKMKSATGWSTGKKHGTSIPDATTLRPNFSMKSAGIRIVTNRSKAPHAGPFDLGNSSDGTEQEGTFTNGHGGAVSKRPFFFKAAREIEPAAEARMLAAMDIICREAGFH